jgi:hypothetical protein
MKKDLPQTDDIVIERLYKVNILNVNIMEQNDKFNGNIMELLGSRS